ncbi:hypothetical protein DSO57_1016969 [Entomophthora muscae]|uniref:Uncharacterized protein n=1 Tax=Entomophthora muscae TaxID=34485 RepID=A0ACC2UQ20_9FUNG|nr:hypothetical protein DSO57_1016969 [Entomophthora muscae]
MSLTGWNTQPLNSGQPHLPKKMGPGSQQTPLDNWEEFKADVNHNFLVAESLQDIIIQLSNLPQKTTVTAYANEFEEIHHKIQNPAQADNVHTRASFINRMKPSVAALICPEANTSVRNCAINANLIWPSNSDMCKDLVGFAFDFDFGFYLPSLNVSTSMSTHSGLPYQPTTDPGMILTQRDPLCHSVYLMSDH